MNVKKEQTIRGRVENTQRSPCVVKRNTSTQKDRKGGRPKLIPEQMAKSRRRPEERVLV